MDKGRPFDLCPERVFHAVSEKAAASAPSLALVSPLLSFFKIFYIAEEIAELNIVTENLVIATNYEETSFMYYLNAKVTIGFVGNNLEQDSRTIPDVIVYRKAWGNFGAIFNGFLTRHRYEEITFPVRDYPVNNIPELNWSPPFMHRFKTEEYGDEAERVDLFVRL